MKSNAKEHVSFVTLQTELVGDNGIFLNVLLLCAAVLLQG